MTRIDRLFRVSVAKSVGFSKHQSGDVPFITNGFTNNGVKGYVTTKTSDKVFQNEAICVSAFCEVTVHQPPFVGRGNGGSGVIVLEPIRAMTHEELMNYAAYINANIGWRFSYGRMVSRDRIVQIDVPNQLNYTSPFNLQDILPTANQPTTQQHNIRLQPILLTSLFTLNSGDYHNASALPDGDTPLVSCGNTNNGVMRFITVPATKIYENTLTIAYNGQPLTTKYHPYKFAAKDDVAVCVPINPLRKTTYLFLQFSIENEKWRFSYGRKCFNEKLSHMKILAPLLQNGQLDEDLIEEIVVETPYWNYIDETTNAGEITLTLDIIQ